MKQYVIHASGTWAATVRTIGNIIFFGSCMLAIPFFSMLFFQHEAEDSYSKRFKRLIINEFKKDGIDISGKNYPAELELPEWCKKWDGSSKTIAFHYRDINLQLPSIVCKDFNNAKNTDRLLYVFSFITLIFTLLLMLTIGGLGLLAYRNRESLFRFFKPGLYLSQVGTILLLIANCALIISRIYSGNHDIEGVIAMSIIALGIIAYITYQSFRPVRPSGGYYVGKILSKEDQPELWNYIATIANNLGATPPDTIIIGFEPTFFVTEVPINIIDAQAVSHIQGRSLFLSLPYCRLLTKDELTSIIGHEIGHFTGEDTRWSQKFYPIYAHAENTILSLKSMYKNMPKVFFIITLLVFIPSYVFMKFFMTIFEGAEKKINRQRELEADSIGAKITTNETSAMALVRTYLYFHVFDMVKKMLIHTCLRAEIPTNIVEEFTTLCKSMGEIPSLKESLDREIFTHPTDTHPPLHDRLKALGIKLDDVYSKAHAIPSHPASSLFLQAEELEQELTRLEAQCIIQAAQAQQ